jgi:hypothetical protein
MDKNFSELNNAFSVEADIVPISKDSEIANNKIEELKSASNEIKKDYEYTRGNLYSLIEKGQEAVNGILELAQDDGQPRAYEVAGQLIKNVADVTDKLIDLQKKLKDMDESSSFKGPTTVNNALFVGSTAELAKFLKSQGNKD